MNGITLPLATVINANLAKLCEALWGWSPCAQWVSGEPCVMPECPCWRASRLEPFFNCYRKATVFYMPEYGCNAHLALKSHDDLFALIQWLRRHADRPRSEVTTEFFKARAGSVPPRGDQNRAVNLAARIITMVQPSAEHQCGGLLDSGVPPAKWHESESLTEFVASLFPRRDYPSLIQGGPEVADVPCVNLDSITAAQLMKVAHLTLIPMHDLRYHLALDVKRGTVAVFHYTSVLKENLAAEDSRGSEDPPGPRRSYVIPPFPFLSLRVTASSLSLFSCPLVTQGRYPAPTRA